MLCMCCNWIYITGFHKLHGGYGVFEAIYVLVSHFLFKFYSIIRNSFSS